MVEGESLKRLWGSCPAPTAGYASRSRSAASSRAKRRHPRAASAAAAAVHATARAARTGAGAAAPAPHAARTASAAGPRGQNHVKDRTVPETIAWAVAGAAVFAALYRRLARDN